MGASLKTMEEKRLSALFATQALSIRRSAELDAVVEAVAAILECPIAAVSLIDQDTHWIKAETGFGENATLCRPREQAFCDWTLKVEDILVIEDTAQDERVRELMVVRDDPKVRFYAGHALRPDGENAVGTLCVMDFQPRKLTPNQISHLRSMARVCEQLLRIHQTLSFAKDALVAVDRQAELANRRLNLLQQMERMAKIGAWELDLRNNRTVWSDQTCAIYGVPPETVLTFEETLQPIPQPYRDLIEAKFAGLVEDQKPYDIELDFIAGNGDVRRIRAVADVEKGTGGKTTRALGLIQDITESHRTEQRLWRAAHMDALSGIPNRSYFKTFASSAIQSADEARKKLALMMIDLDGFKEINDTLGHHAGDEVIRIVAQRIEQTVSGRGFSSRHGGDEFAVLIDEHSENQAWQVAEELLENLAEPIFLDGQMVRIAASVGIARYPSDARDISTLLRNADRALYRSKRSGRATISAFTPEIEHLFDTRHHEIELVKSAAQDGRMEVHYQPKVRLSDGGLCGFEALVRIATPEGKIIGPAQFSSALSDRESALLIEDEVISTLIRDMVEARALGASFAPVSFNVSPFSFRDRKFAERLLQRLERASIPPTMIEVEVTENVFWGDVENDLVELHRAGVSLSLDDFGTGYASLTHLRDYPIDRIKIDKSFVHGLADDIANPVIVRAIIDIARNLNMTVIAEGIETEKQRRFLAQAGCNEGQGFLFGQAQSFASSLKGLMAKA